MTRLSVVHDRATVVPVPGEAADEQRRRAWIEASVAELRMHHPLDDATGEVIRTALRHLHGRAVDGPGATFGIYEPATGAFSMLRLVVIERELDDDERRAFLSPSAVLRPQLRTTPSTSFGVGCSSTTLDDASSGRSSVRWLFIADGTSVLATLGPVAAPAVVPMGAIVEQLLASSTIEGVALSTSPRFDVSELIARVDGAPGWRV